MANRYMEAAPVLLDVKTAAVLLSVSERTAWDLVGRGELKSIKIGSRRLIPRTAISEFVESKCESVKAEAVADRFG